MEQPGTEIYLGRQPILDLRRHLFAYELLFRSSRRNFSRIGDSVRATATVIVNTFNGLGVEAALGDRIGFINVDEDFLFSDMLELLPAHAVVLEILETVPPSPQVIARCRALRAAGYRLALDDLTQVRPDYGPLLQLVEIIKVDISTLSNEQIAKIAEHLRPLQKQLLAEKVESQEQMEYCRLQGFTLFQGYFFARPSIIAAKRVDYARLTLVRLLGMAIGDAETACLEAELKREPALVVKLLRMLNSVAYNPATTITSLRHAITLLGRRQLQRWLQLLIFAATGSSDSNNPLLSMAATRGRIMELLAEQQEPNNQALADQAFMAGVISLMPAVFGISIEEIISPLHLPEAVQLALLEKSGTIGQYLSLAESCETEGIHGMHDILTQLGLTAAELNSAHTQALAWANRLDENEEAP